MKKLLSALVLAFTLAASASVAQPTNGCEYADYLIQAAGAELASNLDAYELGWESLERDVTSGYIVVGDYAWGLAIEGLDAILQDNEELIAVIEFEVAYKQLMACPA